MSGVTALITSTGGNVTGNITLASTQPGLLSVSNTTTPPYQINFSPISAELNSLNGKIGAVNLGSSDGLLSVTPDPVSGAIDLKAYNAPTNTSGIVATNIPGNLAWKSAGGLSTRVYTVGDIVIYDNTAWICIADQPIGSAPPNTVAFWTALVQPASSPIGLINNGSIAVIDVEGSFYVLQNDLPGNTNQINITATEVSGGTGNGVITISADRDILVNAYDLGGSNPAPAVNIAGGTASGDVTITANNQTAGSFIITCNGDGSLVKNLATPSFSASNIMMTWIAQHGDWGQTIGYQAGQTLFATTPGAGRRLFTCIAGVPPSQTGNPNPLLDQTHWRPFYSGSY